MDKVKRLKTAHHWLLRHIARTKTFQYIFSELTVQDTVTIPRTKLYSLLLRKLFRFNYQLIWSTLDQTCLDIFLYYLNEQEILPFLSKAESTPPNYPTLILCLNWRFYPWRLQRQSLRTDLLIKILMKHVRVKQWSPKKLLLKKSQQSFTAGFQNQTRTTSQFKFKYNQYWNHWSTPFTKIFEISFPTICLKTIHLCWLK